MPKLNCYECKHYKYCKIRKLIQDAETSFYLVYCPLQHISNYRYFKKKEKHYLKQLEAQKYEQATLEEMI